MKSYQTTTLGLILLAGIACDPQVSEQYTGEVMLRLEGSVELIDKSQKELKPALSFITPEGSALVAGEVEGIFPSNFRLSLTSPPPKAALVEGLAFGQLILASSSHPSLVELPSSTEYADECDETETGGTCEWTQTHCTQEGECLEMDFECTVVQCEEIASTGNASILTSPNPRLPGESEDDGAELAPPSTLSESVCYGNTCLKTEETCNNEDDCYRVFRRCDVTPITIAQSALATGGIAECTIKQQRGDTSILEHSSLVPVASNYVVLYVAPGAPTEGLSYLGLENAQPGYNVIKTDTRTTEQWIEESTCTHEAPFKARALYNAEHDTDYTVADWEIPDGPREAMDALASELHLACFKRPIFEIIEDPESAPMNIQLGEPPPL